MSWFVTVVVGVFPMLETNSKCFLSSYTVKTPFGNFAQLRKEEINYLTCCVACLDRSNYNNDLAAFAGVAQQGPYISNVRV